MRNLFKVIVTSIITAEAKLLLKKAKPTIIAITGNVGKTSTKDAIYTALKQSHYVRKSQKSYNSDIGVPLSILGLDNAWNNPWLWLRNIIDGAIQVIFNRSYPEVLVLEAGVDRPGDMKKLASWLSPDVVVLTRFPDVPVHIEFFASPEAVVEEKMQLVYGMKSEGVVIYNHDDERITAAIADIPQRVIGFGRYQNTDYTAHNDAVRYEAGRPTGLTFSVQSAASTATCTVEGTLGNHMIYTYLAALAVAAESGVSLAAGCDALAQHEPAPGRMRLLPGLNDSIIIDDTYNASPAAMQQAVLTLDELQGERKIAVLGDMLELGKHAGKEHETIGTLLGGVDLLVTIGVRSRTIAKTALEAGMSEKNIFQYDSATRAAEELLPKIKPGDIILVKASQGIRAEKIVERLLANPTTASRYLVRQSDAWKNR